MLFEGSRLGTLEGVPAYFVAGSLRFSTAWNLKAEALLDDKHAASKHSYFNKVFHTYFLAIILLAFGYIQSCNMKR